jgi:hypothetical protein
MCVEVALEFPKTPDNKTTMPPEDLLISQLPLKCFLQLFFRLDVQPAKQQFWGYYAGGNVLRDLIEKISAVPYL